MLQTPFARNVTSFNPRPSYTHQYSFPQVVKSHNHGPMKRRTNRIAPNTEKDVYASTVSSMD